VGVAGETRAKGSALEGAAPHPPRGLSRPLGGYNADERKEGFGFV